MSKTTSKSDLLKEAIADAKTIRETAITNAKAALEEAFTPQLRSMFSAKIQEIEETENTEEIKEVETEEEVEETAEVTETTTEATAETETVDEELTLDELLAELEIDEKKEEVSEVTVEDEAINENEVEEAKKDESEEEIKIEDMSNEDLTKFIEDVIADMVATGELEAGEGETEKTPEDAEVETDVVSENGKVTEGLDKVKGVLKGIAKAFNPFTQPVDYVKEMDKAIAKDAELKNDKEFMAQYNFLKGLAGTASAASTTVAANSSGAGSKTKSMEENAVLAEALKTINVLKGQLKENNILNAKLLYVNKIFKAKSLTEGEKRKILEVFDKTSSIKEIKLVYESLLGSFNKPKIAQIKESRSMGSASRSMSNSVIKKPIVEVDAQIARMQVLAGIKPKN